MLSQPRRADPPDNITSDAGTSPASDVRYEADDALRVLYAQHGQALLAYAERFTGDRGRAEDIVQETFLRAWRQLPGLLDDERPVRAWLLRVTRRLLIDTDRAARARPTLVENNQSTEPVDDGGLSQLLNQTILLDAMQQLSPAHQQIVIETFFLGTPMHLTAARLGVPAGTARSRLHYALSQLRRQLESGCLAA
jgi:RNA polymerase sigma-70 factor (ECF subfamily)